MKQKSTISSANGQSSQPQCLKNTGRTEYSMATSPTLLPTPTARDTRMVSPKQKPRDDLTCAVELGATKTKHSLFSLADSPVSHSVTQGEEKARQMTAISGQTCFESYKTSSQTGSSLKMCVASLLGTTAWYSSRCALEGQNYEVQPFIIPACAVNAPHRRDRVWIIAHAKNKRNRAGFREIQGEDGEVPKRNDNAKPCYPDWRRDWREVALATCNARMDDGLSREVDGISYSFAKWRNESIKAYGNAIVPQVAMEIFRAIRETINVN